MFYKQEWMQTLIKIFILKYIPIKTNLKAFCSSLKAKKSRNWLKKNFKIGKILL